MNPATSLTAFRNPNCYSPEHELFRQTVRQFAVREIAPHATAWDEAGGFPRELYQRAAAAGLLGLGYPEAYGGTPCDVFHRIVLAEELAWGGSGLGLPTSRRIVTEHGGRLDVTSELGKGTSCVITLPTEAKRPE